MNITKEAYKYRVVPLKYQNHEDAQIASWTQLFTKDIFNGAEVSDEDLKKTKKISKARYYQTIYNEE